MKKVLISSLFICLFHFQFVFAQVSSINKISGYHYEILGNSTTATVRIIVLDPNDTIVEVNQANVNHETYTHHLYLSQTRPIGLYKILINGVLEQTFSVTDDAPPPPTDQEQANSFDEALLIINSAKTGANHSFAIAAVSTVGDLSPLQTLTIPQPAGDATFSINGLPMTRTSNVISDVIEGVELTLMKGDLGVTSNTLSVTVDTAVAEEKIKDFVKNYNKVMRLLNDLTYLSNTADIDMDEERRAELEENERGIQKTKADEIVDKKDKNNTQRMTVVKKGIFFSDVTVKSLQSALQATLSNGAVNPGGVNVLADLGILSDAKTGELKQMVCSGNNLVAGDGKLKTMLTQNIDGVTQFFVGTAQSDGLVKRLESLISSYTGEGGQVIGSPKFTTKMSSLKKENTEIQKQRIKLEEKLNRMDTELRLRFSRLDGLLSKLKGQSERIHQELKGLPQPLSWGGRN
jgi:flagellar capping protein FliD